jgi:hypothetical protein
MPRDLVVLLASLSLAAGAAAMPKGPYLTLGLGSDRGAAGTPVSVTLEADDAGRALGRGPLSAAALTLCTEQGAPVAWQASELPEGRILLSFLPPEGASTLRVYPTPDPALAPLAPPDAVTVTALADGGFSVGNRCYRVTHDPTKLGGLPSRIEFADGGKVFESFSFNDRLHHAERLGWLLREDPTPTVEVLERGPVCATVRVTARYMQGGKEALGRPRAVYDFHYFAGSPAVLIEARVTQEEPVTWDELHIVELNWPDESFGQWAGGGSATPVPLKADSQSHGCPEWAAVTDGSHVLGVLASRVLVYDGRGGYGTYLHGPWGPLSTTEAAYRLGLYIGTPADGVAAVEGAAKGFGARTTPRIGSWLLATVQAEVEESSSPGLRWAASLAERTLAKGLPGETLRLLTAAQQAARAGADPVAAAVDVRPGERLHTLRAGNLACLLRQWRGEVSLASLYDSRAGRETLAGEQPLWRADIHDAEKHSCPVDSTSFSRCKARAEGDRLVLAWSEPTDERLAGTTAEQVLTTGRDRITAKLTVQAGPTCSLRTVTPLTLELGALGETGEDDALVVPLVSGQRLVNPFERPVDYHGEYPSGWCSMQFGAMYDPRGGLYFGCEDPTAWFKVIGARSDERSVTFETAWSAEDAGLPGNRFEQTGLTAYELFAGDWFDAGRVYRRWLEREAPWWPDRDRADTPQWMKDVAIWALADGAREDCVARVKAMAAYMGVPTAFHWYSWHQIPFDVEYPHYFPTRPGMDEGVRELQAAGVRVMPYINGRLWDSALDDFKSTGIAAATKDEAGNPNIEEYGSGAKLAAMCPTQELWRSTVRDIVLRLTGPEVGVDGVYVDQIAAAAPRWCFDATHGHPVGGGHWWTTDGYWPLLDALREKLHAERSEKMITTECNAEAFANRIDGFLTWHFQYENEVPLFASLYAGRVQLFSRAYNGKDDQSYRMKGAQSLVWGEQIGWISPSIIDHPVNGPYFRRLARMRYALRAFLSVGEMEHPPTVEGDIPDVTSDWAWGGSSMVTYPALQAGAWRAADGRLATIFANTTLEPLSFTWKLDGRYCALKGRLTRVTEDGESEGPAVRTPGKLDVTLGPGEIVAYVGGGAEPR